MAYSKEVVDRFESVLNNPDKQLKEVYNSLLEERDLIEAYNIYREVYKKFITTKLTHGWPQLFIGIIQWY